MTFDREVVGGSGLEGSSPVDPVTLLDGGSRAPLSGVAWGEMFARRGPGVWAWGARSLVVCCFLLGSLFMLAASTRASIAQTGSAPEPSGLEKSGLEKSGPEKGSVSSPELVIIDTDIGDDIDDAFAVGLALSSPELRILGITSAWGDTHLKARLLDRLLCETGRSDIPVAVGIAGTGSFSQALWAERQPDKAHPEAVDFMLGQIKKYPGQITLIAIAPFTNVGAAIRQDAATFRQLKRIVIMGGSVRRGYNDFDYAPGHGPDAEYNIAMDVPAAQALFEAGVPLYVMPLDSTQLKLDESKRQLLFTRSTRLTDALALLYEQWSLGHSLVEPTLFDDIAVAYAIDPSQCPVTPLRIKVDAKGFTREVPGQPNSFVCLNSDSDIFFKFYMPRMLQQKLSGACERTP